MTILQALLTNPKIVLRHRNIFLLSHMRANTSLFGHLIGSHPWVEGYYEMHIGYYSWKSLWRQRLLHFAQHRAKPDARYLFDKILHDGHAVSPKLLQRKDSRTIFMLRAPEHSIKSLIVLYRQKLPHLPEATIEGATQYYIKRLATLSQLAQPIAANYFYLDAEALITATDSTLAALSDWLEFETPILSEYQTFSHTGKGNTGDPSSRLKSGRVSRANSDYSEITLPPDLGNAAKAAYQTCRKILIGNSMRNVTT